MCLLAFSSKLHFCKHPDIAIAAASNAFAHNYHYNLLDFVLLYKRETQGLLHIGESFPCHFPQLPLHELKMGTLNTKESLHTALLDHLCVYMYLFLYMYLYFHVYLYLYLYSHGEELCAEAITPYWTIPKAAFMHTPMI